MALPTAYSSQSKNATGYTAPAKNATGYTAQSKTTTEWNRPINQYGYLMQSGAEDSYYLIQSNGDFIYITRGI